MGGGIHKLAPPSKLPPPVNENTCWKCLILLLHASLHFKSTIQTHSDTIEKGSFHPYSDFPCPFYLISIYRIIRKPQLLPFHQISIKVQRGRRMKLREQLLACHVASQSDSYIRCFLFTYYRRSPLWFKTAMNRNASTRTGPLARPLARSLTHSLAPICTANFAHALRCAHSFARSLTPSLQSS